MKRAPSTICRELRRHGGHDRFRATRADSAAWERAKQPKPCELALEVRLKQSAAEKLQLDWSPEQISGWLKSSFPEEPAMHLSHETIYRSLFVQARGVLKKELLSHLRITRTMRHGKAASAEGQKRGQSIDAISIRERPAQVEDSAGPGH